MCEFDQARSSRLQRTTAKRAAVAVSSLRVQCPLWVAPALQVFSVDFCGHFRQYRRLSGLFMFWHCLHWP